MIDIDNIELKDHTDNLEAHYKKAASAPLMLEPMMYKVFTKDFELKSPKFPMEIKIPKSSEHLLKGDLEPERIIKIDSPIISDSGFPMWFDTTLKEVLLTGLGYQNGDSRLPSQAKLDNATIHCIVGGITGGGKSVTLNSLLSCIMYRYGPWEVNLTMADAKIAEFKPYALISPPPHVSSIAATEDADYLISVLEEGLERMRERNKIFAVVGAKDLEGYRVTTGLTLPREVLVFDEVQTMLLLAKKKNPRIIEAFNLYGRLGRSTGFHLVLCSQEPGTLPKEILNNVHVRIALGCMVEVSEKIIGNSAAAQNLGLKGRAILNTNMTPKNEKYNRNFRVPFAPDDAFIEHRKEWSRKADQIGFRRSLSFYDESALMTPVEFRDYMLNRAVKKNELIYLGEPSFVYRDEYNDNFLKIVMDGHDNENTVISSISPSETSKFLSVFKSNVMRMGDSVANFVFAVDNNLTDKFKPEDITPEGRIIRSTKFDDPQFQAALNNIIFKKLALEIDNQVFNIPNLDLTPSVEELCNEVGLANELGSSMYRKRVQAYYNLLGSTEFALPLGLTNHANSPPTKSIVDQFFASDVKITMSTFKSLGCEDGTRLTKDKFTSTFFWILGGEKLVGIARDQKLPYVNRLVGLMADAQTVNARFIFTSPPLSDYQGLRASFRYFILDGMDPAKASLWKIDDYPDTVSEVNGVLYDKYNPSQEAFKFKKLDEVV